MPKQSERAKLMRALEERLVIEEYHLNTRQLTGQVSIADDNYFEALRYLYAAIESTRYLSDCNYIGRPLQYENVILQTNDQDFKEWYQLTKSQFGRLLAAIQNHSVFQSKGVKQQTHPGNQLLVTLAWIPFFGTGASYSCTRMKVNACIGSIRNYEKRVVNTILAITAFPTALASLMAACLIWPKNLCLTARTISIESVGSILLQMKYVLVNLAFTLHVHLIPCFKKLPFLPLEYQKEKFNEKIAKPQIISEHTNGILKGWWGILKQIPHQVKDKKSMNHILKLITVCVILHNLLLDSIDGSWLATACDEGDDNDGDGNYAVDAGPSQTHCSETEGLVRCEEMVAYFEEAGVI
ncbi:hypothetical protein HDU78_011644 [Chytriomyces hyalinus]|nr:hypothetical protein HDU78_011644 [Chytriomyces hyalinus]